MPDSVDIIPPVATGSGPGARGLGMGVLSELGSSLYDARTVVIPHFYLFFPIISNLAFPSSPTFVAFFCLPSICSLCSTLDI